MPSGGELLANAYMPAHIKNALCEQEAAAADDAANNAANKLSVMDGPLDAQHTTGSRLGRRENGLRVDLSFDYTSLGLYSSPRTWH